jgi:hypothetical protein
MEQIPTDRPVTLPQFEAPLRSKTFEFRMGLRPTHYRIYCWVVGKNLQWVAMRIVAGCFIVVAATVVPTQSSQELPDSWNGRSILRGSNSTTNRMIGDQDHYCANHGDKQAVEV